MKMKQWLALGLALALVFAMTGCGPKDDVTPSEPVEPVTSEEPSESPVQGMDVNLAVLSGPTGVGAAKLWADSDAGVTGDHYNITLCTDNQQVMAGLTNGEFDIAAIATNVASTLYNKSEGGIQLAAINTLGVLYILGKGVDETTNSLSDLRGKTLYATGEGANPEYVLNYLLTENGLDPETDVNIVWGTADEVNASMLSAEGTAYCMLPVPAATALSAKSEGNIVPYFSLSDEWDALENGSQLTMGCMVVRTQFAQEHPDAVSRFLNDYARSISYMREGSDEAAQLVADYGIAPSAAIAKKAIPQCNMVCIFGEEMRSAIQGYYEVLFAADPTSIGGSIPDDAFYFLDAIVE